MIVIGGSIRDRDRKCHGRSEWSEMTRESGKWTIVILDGGRKDGCSSDWSEMMRCLRSWSYYSLSR